MNKSQELYKKAKTLIPGGTQLLSKRPEMFLPELWPAYYKKAKGCKIWDLDDNEYIDMSYMGIGSCILGYADDKVNDKVKEAIDNANMTTLNAPEEVELAELILDLHPWAQNVRYSRSGGESMAIAVRIARAKTKKDKILFCGYHGWHDWYLAANLADDKALDGHLLPGLSPLGVPRGLKGSAIAFKYNDTEGFLNLFNKYKNELAAIVMEPIRNVYPKKEFIQAIQTKAKENSIVLIIDEITAGWRLNIGGAHLILGIEPDIAVFGKATSNGYPLGIIIGKKEVMDIAQESFISSTYWTERVGFVAGIETIKQIQKNNIPKYLNETGEAVQNSWIEIAKKNNIKIKVDGIYPLSHFSFDYGNDSLVLKTLFTKLMLKKGFLVTTAYYASYAHKKEYIERYLIAFDDTFKELKKYLSSNKDIKEFLDTPVCHSGFKRLT